ncbi:MAG: hypothetical protein R3344_08420, partial [Acidobacteriota bacterium]|nr:hypothetical protein [Acidobacteriota bacterium]
ALLTAAFSRLQEAFALVRTGHDSPRVYLRFNLLANTAFLLEVSGRPEVAISTMREAFDLGMGDSDDERARWRSTLSYRLGMMHARCRDFEAANLWLERAREATARSDRNGFIHERVLRAAGSVAFESGDRGRARHLFEQGLELSRAGRSRDGTLWHGIALIATLRSSGEDRAATCIGRTLELEDAVEIGTLTSPPPPSPKLPAYIPEIDLEEVPKLDINRYLAGATAPGGSSWIPS